MGNAIMPTIPPLVWKEGVEEEMDVTMALPISFFLVLGKGWWEWQCLSFCSESKGRGHRPHFGFGHFPLPPLLGKVGLSFPPRYQGKKQDSIGEEEVGKAIMPTIPPLA